MNKCLEDCLSCSNSFSIAKEESQKEFDELYCSKKEYTVEENGYCKFILGK